MISILTTALMTHTALVRTDQDKQNIDIDALQDWQNSVENKVNWLKQDHEEFAHDLEKANPGLVVPRQNK